ncbi:hypothetical protein Aduo_009721 [Ancylostoma duodenale]
MKRASSPSNSTSFGPSPPAKRFFIGLRKRSYSRSPSTSPTRAKNPDQLCDHLLYHTRLPQPSRRPGTPKSSETELNSPRKMYEYDWNSRSFHRSRKDMWMEIKNRLARRSKDNEKIGQPEAMDSI